MMEDEEHDTEERVFLLTFEVVGTCHVQVVVPAGHPPLPQDRYKLKNAVHALLNARAEAGIQIDEVMDEYSWGELQSFEEDA